MILRSLFFSFVLVGLVMKLFIITTNFEGVAERSKDLDACFHFDKSSHSDTQFSKGNSTTRIEIFFMPEETDELEKNSAKDDLRNLNSEDYFQPPFDIASINSAILPSHYKLLTSVTPYRGLACRQYIINCSYLI